MNLNCAVKLCWQFFFISITFDTFKTFVTDKNEILIASVQFNTLTAILFFPCVWSEKSNM